MPPACSGDPGPTRRTVRLMIADEAASVRGATTCIGGVFPVADTGAAE